MNSREMHRIRDIDSFAHEIDHMGRNEWPREDLRMDGRTYLMVSSFPKNKVRPIWLCVRLLAKMLILGTLIFDKLDSIESLLIRDVMGKEKQ
jgi:hypothetical protein